MAELVPVRGSPATLGNRRMRIVRRSSGSVGGCRWCCATIAHQIITTGPWLWLGFRPVTRGTGHETASQ